MIHSCFQNNPGFKKVHALSPDGKIEQCVTESGEPGLSERTILSYEDEECLEECPDDMGIDSNDGDKCEGERSSKLDSEGSDREYPGVRSSKEVPLSEFMQLRYSWDFILNPSYKIELMNVINWLKQSKESDIMSFH